MPTNGMEQTVQHAGLPSEIVVAGSDANQHVDDFSTTVASPCYTTLASTASAAKISAFHSKTELLKATPHESFASYVMVQPASNKKAMAWTVFHIFCEVAHPELQGWAACNLCGQKYKYANGTRGLWQHLQNNHKETWKLLHSHSSNINICPRDDDTTGSISTNTPSKRGMIQLDILSGLVSTNEKKIRRFSSFSEKRANQVTETAKWIVSTVQPLNTVENPYFRQMIDAYAPNTQPIGRDKVWTKILELEMGIRTKVSEAIRDETVSVTVDHWCSIAKDNFVGITVHWVDQKWSLQSKQIGCFRHTGESTADALV